MCSGDDEGVVPVRRAVRISTGALAVVELNGCSDIARTEALDGQLAVQMHACYLVHPAAGSGHGIFGLAGLDGRSSPHLQGREDRGSAWLPAVGIFRVRGGRADGDEKLTCVVAEDNGENQAVDGVTAGMVRVADKVPLLLVSVAGDRGE